MHPYGTWPSPISAEAVAAQSLRLGTPALDGDDPYWLEGRPAEGGRSVLVRRTPDGDTRDVTPPPFNVRTRVHEYGGGAYLVDRGAVWFVNFADQRIYRLDSSTGVPKALTPEGACFYADFCYDRARQRLIAVREDHTLASSAGPSGPASHVDPVTTLVAIAADGQATILVQGRDFYSTPRVSPDGSMLAWICWDHPQMPWDGTELWVARFDEDGALTSPMRVAGGPAESIYQPGWSPDGALVFASDRTGWWQLYQLSFPCTAGGTAGADGQHALQEAIRPLLAAPPPESEFGRPQWIFGTSTWAYAGQSQVVVSFTRRGVWHIAIADSRTGAHRVLDIGLDPQDWLAATSQHVYLVAASPSKPAALVRVVLDSGTVEVIKASSEATFDAGVISLPQAIEFPTTGGRTAHAFYYAPRNQAVEGEAQEGRPPLIAISHGGPTAAASRAFDLKIQFWTSRGFAVVDVNYGGSTGYGREYRERLRGAWGEVDVDDMVHAVRYLADTGRADAARLLIRGGSAGGYTTLAAMTFRPGVFRGGASYYGVSDLEALARDTHKFEARYLDSLVGPYPAAADEYRRRSPIHATDRLSCALIFFQGLEDRVVPPNQSEMMADAVRRKGLPVAYVAFAGEQHGFRKADSIVRSLEAELYFYAAIFGLAPAGVAGPVTIDNL
jgi:dipeptidyl aminopeptidase/acylaminoacyl peptidase